MRGIFAVLFVLASFALASPVRTVIVEARATEASIPLPTTTSATLSTPHLTPMPRMTAASAPTTTATAAPIVTATPTTLVTKTKSDLEPRKHRHHHHHDNPGYGGCSFYYDGRLITNCPSVIATTLNYHGTHPLITLDGGRCHNPDCDGKYGGYENWDEGKKTMV